MMVICHTPLPLAEACDTERDFDIYCNHDTQLFDVDRHILDLKSGHNCHDSNDNKTRLSIRMRNIHIFNTFVSHLFKFNITLAKLQVAIFIQGSWWYIK